MNKRGRNIYHHCQIFHSANTKKTATLFLLTALYIKLQVNRGLTVIFNKKSAAKMQPAFFILCHILVVLLSIFFLFVCIQKYFIFILNLYCNKIYTRMPYTRGEQKHSISGSPHFSLCQCLRTESHYDVFSQRI